MLLAHFTTSEGNFTIRLFDQEAPKTVANFTGLAEGTKEWTDPRAGKRARTPYYNGTIFHRVIRGFMIQGGDPLGQGTGGPGYKFEDEFHPKLRHVDEVRFRLPDDADRDRGISIVAEDRRRPAVESEIGRAHV